jgi:hypothetical protein
VLQVRTSQGSRRRVSGCLFRRGTRAGERVADMAGPVLKVSVVLTPLNHASGTGSGLCFPIIFFLHARISPLVLFHIRDATTSCAFSPLDTPSPQCRTGLAPMCPASSCFISLRRASSLHSPPPWSGRCPAMSLCRALPRGSWSRSWRSTSAASPSLPGASSAEFSSSTDPDAASQPE